MSSDGVTSPTVPASALCYTAAMNDPIADNLALVRAEVAAAARRAGRDPASVGLVAVSKTFAADAVAAAIAAGQRRFGENRVQEAAGKFPALKASHPDIELHLIGPLQTNKTREAVALFDVIQSLDRERLAQSLAAEMARAGRRPRLYIQVNIGAEPQKSGVAIEELPRLLTRCMELGLAIEGLMCIPPADAPPEPYFRQLAGLARDHGLAGLSMGMSGDYAVAIAAGATLVRVGSAIFGRRPPLPG
jgi:pyridoxal phosphate enzyme (YggS family)